jgi:5-oxoprolinase (ATP-hydrolysing)
MVGAVAVAERAGLKKIIAFDMGGTSTDVAHYAGELERTFDIEVAGVRIRAPMTAIHTVAAGAVVRSCISAVLYVFRTLLQDDIPLNAGCLKPLDIVIPGGSLLNPQYPAAVVAGNVETSQYIVDALYGALGVLAGSQGTMNNFTFGNSRYQYYETICGGAGAGDGFDGVSGIHTHMTNSRMTDPEILEQRFPVLLREFAIRHGSGGAGRYRGGDGVVRRIVFRESMSAGILSSPSGQAAVRFKRRCAGGVGRQSLSPC